MSVATTQRRLQDKARIVLDAELRTALSSESIPGVSDRLGALRIAVGLDSTVLPDLQQYDTLPRVEVYVTDAAGDYDTLADGQDVVFRIEVAGIAQFDGASPEASARSAAFLAQKAAEVLETYLPDPAGVSDNPIWRVDITAPGAAPAITQTVGTHPYTVRAVAEVTAYARTTFGYTPTYAPATLSPSNHIFEQDGQLAVATDLVSLAGVDAFRSTQVDITAAQLAAASELRLDFGSVRTAGVTDSVVAVYLQRHEETVSETLSAIDSVVAVDLSTFPLESGDRWIVTLIVAGTNQPVTWALRWNVT